MSEKKKILVHSSMSEGDFHLQYGYSLKFDKLKLIFVIVLSTITLGAIFFLIFWSELLRRKFLYTFCEFSEATHLLIKHCDQKFEIVKLNNLKVAGKNWKTFKTRCLSYYLDENSETIRIFEFDVAEYNKEGLSASEAEANKLIYGDCLIDIPIPSIFSFFTKEIMNPYFVFQFFSVVIWMLENYVMFAILIFAICIVTAVGNLFSARGNLQNLKEIVYHECEVKVLRRESEIRQQHEIRLKIDDNADTRNLKGKCSNFKAINSKDITPGDIIRIEPNSTLPCDCILLSGDVLMNECKLTGETVPIIKFPFGTNKFDNIIAFDSIKNKSNILFCGTEVMQVKGEEGEEILGLAWKIGFHSSKGQLIRAILFPNEQPFKFFEESIKFLLLISFLTVFGFTLVLPKLIEIMPTSLLILKFFDIITISIPPSLPAAINIGISLTLDRLKKKNIFCIAPYKTVIGGRINAVCFDKTGTLTEDQMRFKGVSGYFCGDHKFKELDFERNQDEPQPQHLKDDMHILENQETINNILMLMATCHNLAPFQNNNDNSIKIFGDPMEAQMFEHSDAIFSIVDDVIIQRDKEYKILKKFEFTSEHQRMSIVLKTGVNEEWLKYFLKGSPELIKKMISSNKIPSNYDQMLDGLSQKGYRILAIAYKDIRNDSSILHCSREYFEENLHFLGFLLFENPIKPETMTTIQMLSEADLQIKMITGDNPITAINVGREIGIFDQKGEILLSEVGQDGKIFWRKIDQIVASNQKIIPNNDDIFMNERKIEKEIFMPINEKKSNYNTFEEEENSSFLDLFSRLNPSSNIIITGPIFEILYPFFNKNFELLRSLLFKNVKILARMKPSQKSTFILLLQKIGSSVAMVGDGANDCGALKQADIGLALSETEASITAPFTSKDLKVSSIIEILKDSRAGLVTTFQCFKFMVFYSLTQFFTTVLLYFNYSTLSDAQFLYIDFFIVCPLFVTMSMTASAEKLDKERPDASLLSKKTIVSVVGMFLLQIAGQLMVLRMCSSDIDIGRNIEYFKKNGLLKINSVEADALFTFTNFLYIGGMLALSFAKKYKKNLHTNLAYSCNLVLIFFYSVSLMFEKKFRYWSLEVSDELGKGMKIEILLLGVLWIAGLVVFENVIEFLFRKREGWK